MILEIFLRQKSLFTSRHQCHISEITVFFPILSLFFSAVSAGFLFPIFNFPYLRHYLKFYHLLFDAKWLQNILNKPAFTLLSLRQIIRYKHDSISPARSNQKNDGNIMPFIYIVIYRKIKINVNQNSYPSKYTHLVFVGVHLRPPNSCTSCLVYVPCNPDWLWDHVIMSAWLWVSWPPFKTLTSKCVNENQQ